MRPILARASLAAAALAVAVGIATCGGGDDAQTLTRAQYIASTDKLCKASNTRTRTLNVRLLRAAADARNDRQLLRRLAPILERGYGKVRDNAAAFQAANPPPDDAAEIERIREAYDKQANQVRLLAAAARSGDVARFRSLSDEQEEVVTYARRLARGYGFRECGSAKSDAA
ncbi:MAG TPA: hypothetical protein VGO80_18905 [Solirubrobacteraceae bacterium]|nr:hypothetical protein [Solirubrobacteraceae bacterium]